MYFIRKAGKDLEYYYETDPERVAEHSPGVARLVDIVMLKSGTGETPGGRNIPLPEAPPVDEATAGSQNGACTMPPEKA
ncbi:MAG: hypothetical protein R3220_05985, partial [Balneolaceae bacterium]|nr:hypothetical protein [Balneolaceae bacterium]